MVHYSPAAAFEGSAYLLALLLYLSTFVPCSLAQVFVSDRSVWVSTMAAATTSLTKSSEESSYAPTTLATSYPASATLSTVFGPPTNLSTSLSPDDDNDDDDKVHIRNVIAFNYYFVFLAVLAVAIGILLWWLHHKRKKHLELRRMNGQRALARDMEGWVGVRRFMHGRHHGGTFVRREEGLDETGAPPPPYQPKSKTTVRIQPSGTNADIAVPLSTLPRDQNERVMPPPEYTRNT